MAGVVPRHILVLSLEPPPPILATLLLNKTEWPGNEARHAICQVSDMSGDVKRVHPLVYLRMKTSQVHSYGGI